ncbi:MAG: YaiO family outer membrane beta-barrel protein [Sulfuricurvum sp.]|nr:YaiO family outer membrane beta-barrel protein [Sulfuricurvum sp.]MDD5387143.1 YaiO family outer membrane beta-barrel protein [Sulfuricurvum sp.]
MLNLKHLFISILITLSFYIPLMHAEISSAPLAISIDNYDETIQAVSLLIAKNAFEEAIPTLIRMDQQYPKNIQVIELLASLHYWTHQYFESITYYETLYRLTKNASYLENIRDVSNAYRYDQTTQKKNFIMLKGEAYSYGSNRHSEQDVLLQAGLHKNGITWIGSIASLHRYALSDHQNGMEVYSGLGEKEARRWGYLSLYQSPSPSFLPKYDYSAGVYQGIFQDSEIGFVCRRMMFKDTSVDIYKPSITIPLPFINATSLTEELYFVPKTHSYAAVSTFAYNPTEYTHIYYALTLGNGYEVTGVDPLLHTQTFSQALGGSWRFKPSWSIGTAITDGRRSNLYRRTGGEVFLKYFW